MVTTLREERASIWEQMKALSAKADSEGRDLTSEEYEQYNKMEADLDSKDQHVKRIEAEHGYDQRLSRQQVAPEQVPEGVEGYAPAATRVGALWGQIGRAGSEEALDELRTLANKQESAQLAARARTDREARLLFIASDAYRDAWIAYAHSKGNLGEMDDEARAALNVGTGAQGGYTVPAEFYRQLVISERFFGVMRQLARTIVTVDNGVVSIPKVDDSSRLAANWIAEAAGFTESEDAFLQTQLGAFKQGTISKVSDELVLDSAFDILGFVAQSAGQALGILANTAYVAGASGSTTTPEGLFTKATVGFTLATGNTTTITGDSLIELYHSVRPAYRPRGEWVFSDTAIKVIRQLKDSQNRYLWEPSLTVGDPDTLLGRPVYADPDVAVPAANALCGGFGDVNSAYWIRDVQDVTVKILNELYAANGQIGFRTHRRTDGDIVDTLAFKTLKNSAT
jgi:HK97 family phage major capsid protein